MVFISLAPESNNTILRLSCPLSSGWFEEYKALRTHSEVQNREWDSYKWNGTSLVEDEKVQRSAKALTLMYYGMVISEFKKRVKDVVLTFAPRLMLRLN